MPEHKENSIRKKFYANRMAFESILFERELVIPMRGKYKVGLAGVGVLALAHFVLLAQWVVRRGYCVNAVDAGNFSAILSYLEYFKGGIWNLFKPFAGTLDAPMTPPLYYLTYLPALKLAGGNMNWAMILVNSFYILVLGLAVFLAIRRNRNNASGWLGAAVATSFPFVLEMARHPDPRLASMAMVAATYASYINSDDFENPDWTCCIGLFIGLGFLADTMFWVYMLPLVPFVISGLASAPLTSPFMKGLIPGILVGVPWYAYAGIFWLVNYLAGIKYMIYRPGLWNYGVTLVDATGWPLFLLGGLALLWMYFSVFMPYASRKIVAAWLWVPLIVMYFFMGHKTEYMYPAMIPLAIATAIMVPNLVRWHVIAFVVGLFVVNQSGLLNPISIAGVRFIGAPKPSVYDMRSGEVIRVIKELSGTATGLKAAIVGGSSSFSTEGMNGLAAREIPGVVSFYDYAAEMIGISDYVVYKTSILGGQWDAASMGLAEKELTSPWFSSMFVLAAEIKLPDTSSILVYAKNIQQVQPFERDLYQIKQYVIGKAMFNDVRLELKGFDPQTGVYKNVKVFSPYVEFMGMDLYGVLLDISGFRGISPAGDMSDLRILRADSVRIVSAKTTNYAIEKFIAAKYPGFQKVGVELNDTAAIWANRNGKELDLDLQLILSWPTLQFKLLSFSFARVNMPKELLNLFNFHVDVGNNPYGIGFNSITLKKQLLEVS